MDIGVVRFQSRNAETWERRRSTSAERFDYWHQPEDLDEWVPKAKTLTEHAGPHYYDHVVWISAQKLGPTLAMVHAMRLCPLPLSP